MNIQKYELERAYMHPSKWIDAILFSNLSTNGKRIVNVQYQDKQVNNGKRYNVWFLVDDNSAQDLINADSVGSEYWYNWSIYGGAPKPRYYGEELDFGSDDDEQDFAKKKSDEFFGMNQEHYERIRQSIENGNEDEVINDISNEIGRSEADIINFINHMGEATTLFKQANEIAMMIETGQFTKMELFALAKRDIEGLLGVHFNKEIGYDLMNKVGAGKLNPKNYQKVVYQIKNMMDLMEKEGLKGASKIGRRWVSAKNPLIADRRAYLAKEVVKREIKNSRRKYKGTSATINGRKTRVYEGKEAVRQLVAYNKQLLGEEAKGIFTQNKSKLVKTHIGEGKERKLVYYWKKDVKFSRKVMKTSKKALKIARFFI